MSLLNTKFKNTTFDQTKIQILDLALQSNALNTRPGCKSKKSALETWERYGWLFFVAYIKKA